MNDPLTMAGIAWTELLMSDPLLAGYNWTPYEAAPAVEGPRGYVNVGSTSALNEADLAEKLELEIVFEGKPNTLTAPDAVAQAMGHVTRPDIAQVLDALVSDASVSFIGVAEDVKLIQAVVGQIRQYKIGFVQYVTWNVVYEPGP